MNIKFKRSNHYYYFTPYKFFTPDLTGYFSLESKGQSYMVAYSGISAHWLLGRVFPTSPGDWCSMADRVRPKTPKTVLDAALFKIQHNGSRIKLINPDKGVVPSTHLSVVVDEKGSFQVALDYGRQLYLMFSQRSKDGTSKLDCC